MPDRSLDHPDLRPDQCRICLSVNLGFQPMRPRLVSAHCCEPVVDDVWQLCQRHHDERERLVAKYGSAA